MSILMLRCICSHAPSADVTFRYSLRWLTFIEQVVLFFFCLQSQKVILSLVQTWS